MSMFKRLRVRSARCGTQKCNGRTCRRETLAPLRCSDKAMRQTRGSIAAAEKAKATAVLQSGAAAGQTAKASRRAAPAKDESSDASTSSSNDEENQPPVASNRKASQLVQPAKAAGAAKAPAKAAAKAAAVPVGLAQSSDSSDGNSSSDDDEGVDVKPGSRRQPAAAHRGKAGAAVGGGHGGRRYAVSRRGQAATTAQPVLNKAAAVATSEAGESSDSDSCSSGEEAEDKAGPSRRGRGDAQAASGRKRAALELVAGKLDEESLKRMARERPDSINFNLKDMLMRRLQACGHKWRFHLRCGNSMLLYGFGSKRALLDQWARQVLTDGAAVTVNGFNPAVTAKQVALAAAAVLLPSSMRGSSAADIVAAIRNQPLDPDQHVYIVLHNIDGPGLRAPEEQALLADLASCPGVHLAASIDHINAPLMWDVKTAARFRWVYQDATTFSPYFAETMDMQPVLLACFQETTRRGASTALGSMPPTAQAVFRVLAEAQLDDPASPGLTFATLFRMCRERWLVSNEQALRGFLAEFTDHELVVERMAALHGDEREVLCIPMEEDVLKKLLEMHAPQE